MFTSLLRRALGVVSVSLVALVGSPLVGTALAAAPVRQSISPGDGATVKANKPTITATYDVSLDTGASTITLLDGTTALDCPAAFPSAKAIACTPTNSLVDNKTYTVKVHAVNDADGTTSDGTSTFTVDIPSYVASKSAPANGTSSSGTNKVKVAYDEPIDTGAGNYSFAVYDVKNGQRHNELPGSVSFCSTSDPTCAPLPGSKDTIVFTSGTGNFASGVSYQAVVHVQASGNAAAFSDDVVNFSIDSTPPPTAPTVTSFPAYINSVNESAVPFSGSVPAGYNVGVVIYDPNVQDPTGLFGAGPNDRSATTTVADCGSTTCPWTVKVDTTGTPEQSYKWFAYAYDSAGNSTATSDRDIVKDTTPPGPVANVLASDVNSANWMTITGTATDASNTQSVRAIVDDDDPSTPAVVSAPAAPGSSGGFRIYVNVANLSDSAGLSVDVLAYDPAGNPSADSSAPVPAPQKETKPLAFDAAGSSMPASQSVVRQPDSITVHFNEPIRVTPVKDTTSPTQPTLYQSYVCLRDSNAVSVACSATSTTDGRGMVLPLSGQVADDTYSVVTMAVAATCPDKTVANRSSYTSTTCERTSALTVDTFTVDNTPPAVPDSLVINPSAIDASNASSVAVAGHAEPGSRVSLTVVSGAGGAAVAAPDTTADSKSGTFLFPAINVASLPDGTLTFRVTATDAAGNRGAAGTVTAVKNIRPSAPLGLVVTPGDGYVNLSWQPPASNGGSPVSGYIVTASNGATQTVGGTSATVLGLANGKAYTFTVMAKTSASPSGNPTATSPAVTPQYVNGLATGLSAGRVVFGQPITVSGTLTHLANSAGVGNAPITLYGRYDNGQTIVLGHLTTDAYGRWSGRLTPAHNLRIWATYAGDGSNQAATSNVTQVLVSALVRVTSRTSGTTTRVGTVQTITGTVSPNFAGRYVQLWAYSGSYHRTIQQVRLDRYSRYAFRVNLGRGSWLLRVVIVNPPYNATGASGYLRVKRV